MRNIHLTLVVCTVDKIKVKISQSFVAFSEYTNFIDNICPISTCREDLSVLLRTIHSVVNRSPKGVLHEVILVNDQSDINIVPNATEHIAQENLGHLVKLITAPERLGLIRARIFGAKQATGDVLVFLDSHIEGFTFCLAEIYFQIKEFA
jgi:glycosyltransferase involved in cell wall biosynthesis